MSQPTASFVHTSPSDAPCGADARAVTERQLEMLGRLAEVGLNVALAIERRALAMIADPSAADAAPMGEGDIGLAYARVSRAVRLTIALQSKRLEDLKTLGEEAAFEAKHAKVRADVARKVDVQQVVWRVIAAEQADQEQAEDLLRELGERLVDDTCYGDVLSRPFSEVVARICDDLGLSPDWPSLAEEAWAREEIDSGEIGWPLAERLKDRPPGPDWRRRRGARTGAERVAERASDSS